MMKVKKFKTLSILFSLLFVFSFLPMSSVNAETLTEATLISSTQDLENMKVWDINTKKESTVLKSEFTKESEQNEGGTEEFIPKDAIIPDVVDGIIGTDDRTRIEDPSLWPYSAICYVEMEFPNKERYIGSATMYDKNVAVTAGHNLYSEADGGWATNVRVVPGKNGDSEPFDVAYATTISVPQGWTQNQLSNKKEVSNYDWGIIKLNTNIGEKTGYFGVYWTSDSESLKGRNVDVTGYPEEKIGTMWSMNGNITDSSTYILKYTIDTTGGQSGCPVYWEDSSGHRIVGIHTSALRSLNDEYKIVIKANSATRVTKSIFDAMMYFI
jgi:glutamyl endopeptidase